MSTAPTLHPDFPIVLSGTGGETGRAETLMWTHPYATEHGAQEQLRNAAAMPWVAGIRSMPDVHQGYGVPVGSVVAMRQAVSPSAVGVDIGCGMMAVRADLKAEDLPDDLGPMRAAIEKVVPVGREGNDGAAPVLRRDASLRHDYDTLFGRFADLRAPKIADREGRALGQCGSLGSGNHFIEVCTDDEGWVWIMLHSGSRNIGKEIADRHIATAKALSHNIEADLPDPDLAVFLGGTPQMDAYLHDLYWAQSFAMLNRRIMMATAKEAFASFFETVTWTSEINCHHNYVSEETHDGEDLVITRKGAISAQAGQMGLIPGSMGTGSFVVSGLGNPRGYCSASHGAGRKMSRAKAKKTFTVEDLAAQTAGVECRKDQGVVDEIPGAYKSLDEVMAAQTDLVSIEARLTTRLCVKG